MEFQNDSRSSPVAKKSPKCTRVKPSGPVKATTITRSSGTIRNAIRKSATAARTMTCAGLARRRAVSGVLGGAAIVISAISVGRRYVILELRRRACSGDLNQYGMRCPLCRDHRVSSWSLSPGDALRRPVGASRVMTKSLRCQRLFRQRLGLGIVLHHGGVPAVFKFRLSAGGFLARLHLLERACDRLVARLLLGERDGAGELAGFADEALGLRACARAKLCLSIVYRFPGGIELLQPEGDNAIE